MVPECRERFLDAAGIRDAELWDPQGHHRKAHGDSVIRMGMDQGRPEGAKAFNGQPVRELLDPGPQPVPFARHGPEPVAFLVPEVGDVSDDGSSVRKERCCRQGGDHIGQVPHIDLHP